MSSFPARVVTASFLGRTAFTLHHTLRLMKNVVAARNATDIIIVQMWLIAEKPHKLSIIYKIHSCEPEIAYNPLSKTSVLILFVLTNSEQGSGWLVDWNVNFAGFIYVIEISPHLPDNFLKWYEVHWIRKNRKFSTFFNFYMACYWSYKNRTWSLYQHAFYSKFNNHSITITFNTFQTIIQQTCEAFKRSVIFVTSSNAPIYCWI